MMMQFNSPIEAADALAEAAADALRADIASSGRASLVVSGGRTPVPLFESLRRRALDWSKVTITLADDRWVAPDHADSNDALVREFLLQDAAAEATFVPLYSDAGLDAGEAIKRLADVHRPWSAVLLGMGGDGHFASIFPELDEVHELLASDAPPLAITAPKNAPHHRITMTLETLRDAQLVALFITGANKLDVFEAALAAEPDGAPPIRALAERTDLQVYFGA